jgi:hypothetical protein
MLRHQSLARRRSSGAARAGVGLSSGSRGAQRPRGKEHVSRLPAASTATAMIVVDWTQQVWAVFFGACEKALGSPAAHTSLRHGRRLCADAAGSALLILTNFAHRRHQSLVHLSIVFSARDECRGGPIAGRLRDSGPSWDAGASASRACNHARMSSQSKATEMPPKRAG